MMDKGASGFPRATSFAPSVKLLIISGDAMNYRIFLATILLFLSILSIFASLRLGDPALTAAIFESLVQLFAATALGSSAYLIYEYIAFRKASKNEALARRHRAFFQIVETYKTIVKLRRELKLFVQLDQDKIMLKERNPIIDWFKEFNNCQIDIEILRREMEVAELIDVDMTRLKDDLSKLDNFARSLLVDIDSLLMAAEATIEASSVPSINQFCFGDSPSQHVGLFQSIKDKFFV